MLIGHFAPGNLGGKVAFLCVEFLRIEVSGEFEGNRRFGISGFIEIYPEFSVDIMNFSDLS